MLLLQILKEFELAYPNVNASAFLDKWLAISPQIRNILFSHYQKGNFKTDWPADVENILVLLKMFPSRQVGRNVIASDSNFKKALEEFIHFEPVRIILDFIENNKYKREHFL